MSETDISPVLTHLDAEGRVRMVDVGDKTPTQRMAIAEGQVHLSAHAWKLLSAQANAKGEVLNTARIAGILAAKRCAELIPLCHTLPLSFVGVDFTADESRHILTIRSTCRTRHETGVEMEAMTACSVAALTVYDMCKAADKSIEIDQIRLVYKSGGKSGEWHRDH
ncbi:Cyclic pyranopterin monophosphate synthase OS=Castellaniella defragrans OX=75697 GN=moaC PE=3 SV=1 [Castellaniella defragrans]